MAASMRAVARSARILQILRNSVHSARFTRRNYLSSAYACNDEWLKQRREDPLLQNIEYSQYFVDISRKFTAKVKENLAVNVDIFMNVVEDDEIVQEVENLLNRLRRSKHTVRTLPSTSCAAVRYMLSIGQDKRLVDLLEDRYSYGLFLDTPTGNLLLDHFLTTEAREREAAKVAAQFMLQEDPGNEITRVLGLIACIKYLSAGANASPWIAPSPPAEQEEDNDDEIEYVRVPNLTNFFFDDHFDLNDPDHILGKTLLHFSKGLKPGLLSDSVRLIGLARRGRWDQLKEQLANVKEICEDAKQLCLERLTEPTEAEDGKVFDPKEKIGMTSPDISELLASAQRVVVPDWLASELDKIKVNNATVISLLEAEAKNLASHELADIDAQKASFVQWAKDRKTAIDEQRAAIDREQRIEAIRAKKKELVEKEELYYAFENWNKIEMILAEVEKDAVKEDKVEEYIPPEVKKRKSLPAKNSSSQRK